MKTGTDNKCLLMNNKTVVITGATSGIGKASSLELARMGANTILTYRNKVKGKQTLDEIVRVTGNENVRMMELDLASLESVREFALNFKKEFDRLDVLINNAGGYYGYRKTTREGFEYTFGVNHLGHFLLTNLLKDHLVSSRARIINVSSGAQSMGHINFNDLMLENRFFGFRAYSQAKLANIIFTYELDRRWGDAGVTVNAMHPGAVRTNFGMESSPIFRFLLMLGKPFLKSPAKGADTIIYLAASSEVDGISGSYFVKRKPKKSIPESYDREVGKRLWDVSCELTGI
jgi:NAD(P)-dependent dehydrogenase (short-subunit alcohol dehydrogenase family)